uniref:pre-mRNA 3' end processing protein WDR33 n=1 Tax=Aceria tosichella TaxID=561515 RepID=A0A6G1S5C4_9ACAR
MATPPNNRPNGYILQQLRQQQEQMEFDGKRLRKAIARKTVDHNTSMVKYLQSRIHKRCPFIQPDIGYSLNILPAIARQNPMECVTTKFVRTSTNKMRCPIFCLAWTPEGRRLITGASSGELTLWNGLTFNFETILQAHDSPIRCMSWTNTDSWLVSADHGGYVKYWQSNMNNVKMFQAHKEAIRAISFSPTDKKFVTCSDDSTVRLWDFQTCNEEAVLRGHGADVKSVDWHPTKSLLISGSKDNQQPVKLWDARTKRSLATIHAHKNAVTDVKWNKLNGNWLITSSRDHTIKLFDLRNLNQEVQVFKGHKKESCCLKWHPIHEGLFASGGADGYVYFWHVGSVEEVGIIKQAHDQLIWCIDWHPLGHILTTGSNDHTCKFWTRNRPGDKMTDKYNLQINMKQSDEGIVTDKRGSLSEESAIPGLEL